MEALGPAEAPPLPAQKRRRVLGGYDAAPSLSLHAEAEADEGAYMTDGSEGSERKEGDREDASSASAPVAGQKRGRRAERKEARATTSNAKERKKKIQDRRKLRREMELDRITLGITRFAASLTPEDRAQREKAFQEHVNRQNHILNGPDAARLAEVERRAFGDDDDDMDLDNSRSGSEGEEGMSDVEGEEAKEAEAAEAKAPDDVVTAAYEASEFDRMLDGIEALSVEEHRVAKEAQVIRMRMTCSTDRLRDVRNCLGDQRMAAIQKTLYSLGFTPSQYQALFFEKFTQACLPLIYGSDWSNVRDRVLRELRLDRIRPEVLIQTARRFGKTTSVAMFVTRFENSNSSQALVAVRLVNSWVWCSWVWFAACWSTCRASAWPSFRPGKEPPVR